MKVKRHNLVFVLALAVSLFVWSQMGMFLLHEAFGITSAWGLLEYCMKSLHRKLFILSAFAGLNLFIAYSVLNLIRQSVLQWRHAARWRRFIETRRDEALTLKYRRKHRRLKLRVTVVDTHRIIALTYGFLKPGIVISTATIASCSERELEAILLHERAHCLNRDPLRIMLLKLLRDSLPFMPILRQITRYIEVWAELEADRYAVRLMRSRIYLAQVLLRFSHMEPGMQVGTAFADVAINYRLQQLIEPRDPIRVPLMKPSTLFISMLGVLALSGIVASGCS